MTVCANSSGAKIRRDVGDPQRDGSPQASLVWMALRSTPDGDELVSAHLNTTIREVAQHPARSSPGSGDRRRAKRRADEPVTPHLVVTGTAHLDEGGVPDLATELTAVRTLEFVGSSHPRPHHREVLTRVRIDKGRRRPVAPFGASSARPVQNL